jgi:hypothetical protein
MLLAEQGDDANNATERIVEIGRRLSGDSST